MAAKMPVILVLTAAVSAAAPDRIDFGHDIRPILSENCFHCHGQDATKRMAGLRLDTFEDATAVRGGRAAVAPWKPEASLVFQRISEAAPARRMPPPGSNRSLTPEQIALVKRWIGEGGKYSKHWAFEPPTRPRQPKVANAAWVRNAIDAFVLARLERERWKPSAPATPAAWLRRVSLDLSGLPPSPGAVDGFAAEVSKRGEIAYESAVDGLLASERYGERMAMDWLDVARYADTHGFNNDAARSMWRWRDWVIDSFNANVRYDRFLTEQLAGDLMPGATLEQRIATGYGRNHVINSEGGIIDEEYRVEYVADRVRTLGMSWLGLTLECARCHDHKYDPLSQRDYYRFYAFFNNVPEIGEDGRVANAVPMIPAPTREQSAKMQELESAIAALDARSARRERGWQAQGSIGESAKPRKGPADAAMRVDCESQAGFVKSAGILGQACEGPASGKPETGPLEVGRRAPLTLSLWIEPSSADRDAALLSAMDFARNRAATTYGTGIEMRLIGGEIEFRFGQRFPAYSMRVQSVGARITPGKWTHAAVVYDGAPPEANRGHASWVKLYVDGRELAVRVLNDGVPIGAAKAEKALPTKFRIGWDNKPGSAAFQGRIDEVAGWARALPPTDVEALFEQAALTYAASNGLRPEWVRRPARRASDSGYAETISQRDKLHRELLALKREVPTVMVMEEMRPPRQTHVLIRGGYNTPGAKVDAGVPEAILGAWPTGAPANRLGLAQWLTGPNHPLTARVVVNRFWQQLFGQGIVKTSENFGLQGETPTHPELLDWLAREFIDSGWNVKALIKQIVLSATYRQDSAAPEALIGRDPENRLLARGPRFRLPAEVIRDQALDLAGLLQHKTGGPSVFPVQPADLYKNIVVAADYPGTSWIESKGSDLYRRSLYTFWKRTVPHPTMIVFDAPDREVCVVRRATTNTPLQALTLLNDPIYVEAARQFAARMIREGGADRDARLAFGFRLATGRPADAEERRTLRESFDKLVAGGQSEAAAYESVASMILNLDEVVTKG
jgi:hypothetical protein